MGKRKIRESDHVQEQCDVWLTAQGRQLTTQRNKQRVLSVHPVNIIGYRSMTFDPLPSLANSKTKQSNLMAYFQPKTDRHQVKLQPRKADTRKETTRIHHAGINSTTAQPAEALEKLLIPLTPSVRPAVKHSGNPGEVFQTDTSTITVPPKPIQSHLEKLSDHVEDNKDFPTHFVRSNPRNDPPANYKIKRLKSKSASTDEISEFGENNKHSGNSQESNHLSNLRESNNGTCIAVQRANVTETFSDQTSEVDFQISESVVPMRNSCDWEGSCFLLKRVQPGDPAWLRSQHPSNQTQELHMCKNTCDDVATVSSNHTLNFQNGSVPFDSEECDKCTELSGPVYNSMQYGITSHGSKRLSDKIEPLSQTTSVPDFADSEFPCKRYQDSENLDDTHKDDQKLKLKKNLKRKCFLIDSDDKKIEVERLSQDVVLTKQIEVLSDTKFRSITVDNQTKPKNTIGTEANDYSSEELKNQLKMPNVINKLSYGSNLETMSEGQMCSNMHGSKPRGSKCRCVDLCQDSIQMPTDSEAETQETSLSQSCNTFTEYSSMLLADSEFPVVSFRRDLVQKNAGNLKGKIEEGNILYDDSSVDLGETNLIIQNEIFNDSEYPVVSLNQSKLQKGNSLKGLSDETNSELAVHTHVVEEDTSDDDNASSFSVKSCGSDNIYSEQFTQDSSGVLRLKF